MKKLIYFRNQILEKLTHNIAVPLLMSLRKNEFFRYSMNDLENFPQGTIGKDLYEYLEKKGFTLMKNYERHDCKHIIFEYEMDQIGEAKMQFYFLGNGYFSVPVISTVLAYSILMPEEWATFYQEFKKGRKGVNVKPLDNMKHNQLVKMNTEDLKKQFLSKVA